jgi:hypothetical protein
MNLTLNAVKKRAHSLGIRGYVGGWITVGKKNLQGWYSVYDFVTRKYQNLPENLKEIADGRRVGIPTLCKDDTDEMVAALLSKGEVSLRSDNPLADLPVEKHEEPKFFYMSKA